MPAAALCCGGLEPPKPGPGRPKVRSVSHGLQLFGLLPPWSTPHGASPRPPPSVGERVRPVRRLQCDVELAALASELVDRAAKLGDVDRRRQLDLTQRVALRLLRGGSRELAVNR